MTSLFGLDPRRVFSWLAAAFALLLIWNVYRNLFMMPVFGHDEVHYYSDFTFKLKEEGRWINFTIHQFLRWVSLPIHAVLYITIFWLVWFLVFFDAAGDRLLAGVAASVAIITLPFVFQSLWPATLWPTGLAMLGLIWLKYRRLAYPAFYTVAGIILCGMMQNYYFALPLLFIREMTEEKDDWRCTTKRVVGHLIFWVIGLLVGIGFSILAVYVATNQWGIEIAEWRKPQPIKSALDIARNVEYMANVFVSQLEFAISTMFGSISLAAFTSAVGLFAVVSLASGGMRVLITFGILATVAVGFFAASTPLAPVVQTRSVVALWLAILGIFAAAFTPASIARVVAIIFFLIIGARLSMVGAEFLTQHNRVNSYALGKIASTLPKYAPSYRRIAIFGTYPGKAHESLVFNSPPLLRPVILETGTYEFWDCRIISSACAELWHKAGGQSAEGIRFVGEVEGTAVVSLGPIAH